MRITSHHIIDQAALATSRAQSRVADATNVATSGLRVGQASDDPVAWVASQRERVRQTLSEGTGAAIATSRSLVEQTDTALATINDVISQARTLAMQAASAGYSATERATLGTQVTSLYQAALAAANSQSADGAYLLAGSRTTAPPFDAAGVYHGDDATRAIATSAGGMPNMQDVSVTGARLTATDGIDVLPELAKLALALANNDVPGIQAGIGALGIATTQMSRARGQSGSALQALESADTMRAKLAAHLSELVGRLVEADSVTAATNLAQSTAALEATKAITSHVIATLAPAS